LRAAAEFMAPTEVKTETTFRETATIRRENGTSKGEARKTFDDITRTKVEVVDRLCPAGFRGKTPARTPKFDSLLAR
jgi:hypothetical protein